MICPNCSHDCGDAEYCTNCGTRLKAPQEEHAQPGAAQTQAPASGVYTVKQDTAPLSTGDFVLLHLINRIPIVRLVMWFVWGFSQDCNLNRRNWARAELIWLLINIVLCLFSILLIAILGGALFTSFSSLARWLESLLRSF